MAFSGFLLGTLSGIVGKTIFEIIKHKLERKDKYYFALLERKISGYQHAYFLVDELMQCVHGSNDAKRVELCNEAKRWFSQNCLYLKQEHRNRFKKFVLGYQAYPDLRESWKTGASSQDELKERWNFLRTGFQRELAEEIDENYYKYTRSSLKLWPCSKADRP